MDNTEASLILNQMSRRDFSLFSEGWKVRFSIKRRSPLVLTSTDGGIVHTFGNK